MSSSNSGSVKPKSPPPRSQSLALSPTAVGELQAKLKARSEASGTAGSQQVSGAAAPIVTGQSLPAVSYQESGLTRVAPVLREADRSRVQPHPRLSTAVVDISSQEVLAKRSGPETFRPIEGKLPPPLPLPRPQPPQRQPVATSVVSPDAAAASRVQPEIQPAAELGPDKIERNIVKTFASHLPGRDEVNVLRQPDGHKSLPRLCHVLLNMIETQGNANDQIRSYGQLVLQLLNYGGADRTLDWNKDRFDAAYKVIKEINEKVLPLYKTMSALLVSGHMRKAERAMFGLAGQKNKSDGKTASEMLSNLHIALAQALALDPEQASRQLVNILDRAL